MLTAARSALLGGASRHAPPLGLGFMQQHVRRRRAKYVTSPFSTELALLMDALTDGADAVQSRNLVVGDAEEPLPHSPDEWCVRRHRTRSPDSSMREGVSRDLAAATHRVQVREELLAEATRLGLGPTRVTSAEPSSRCEPSGV